MAGRWLNSEVESLKYCFSLIRLEITMNIVISEKCSVSRSRSALTVRLKTHRKMRIPNVTQISLSAELLLPKFVIRNNLA